MEAPQEAPQETPHETPKETPLRVREEFLRNNGNGYGKGPFIESSFFCMECQIISELSQFYK